MPQGSWLTTSRNSVLAFLIPLIFLLGGNSASIIIPPTTGVLCLGAQDGLSVVQALQSLTASCTRETQLIWKPEWPPKLSSPLLPTYNSRQNSSGDHAECSNMKAMPCWFAHGVRATASSVHAEQTHQESKKEQQEKANPGAINVCFPFLLLLFVGGCILACSTVSWPLDTQEKGFKANQLS